MAFRLLQRAFRVPDACLARRSFVVPSLRTSASNSASPPSFMLISMPLDAPASPPCIHTFRSTKLPGLSILQVKQMLGSAISSYCMKRITMSYMHYCVEFQLINKSAHKDLHTFSFSVLNVIETAPVCQFLA